MSKICQKLVVVGNSACGKKCLLIVFSKETLQEVLVTTVFKNYVADVEVNGKWVELALSLSYVNSHIIFTRFAIDSPKLLDNVQEIWISEVLHFCQGLLLVHRIEGLRQPSQKPVTPKEGMAIDQKIGSPNYLESSVKIDQGV
ncbi:P-loop containing nucleoside triphosphate hydrolase protein [Phakopsora pachyrhizi]|uniref:P-loop containing nucleoside triphosphate hydrolase protein n=1 Tax=Phakopsora pachyrhizi TaxID=170000 RepID=A0AAV0ATZ6_PHAPC|nr:P-loop containing nucleoside triphosphate hydrolase protein [Phakopsora pachyrhizi]